MLPQRENTSPLFAEAFCCANTSLSRLTIVDTDDGTDHLRHDEHVPEMSLDTLRLFSRGRVYPASTKIYTKQEKTGKNGDNQLINYLFTQKQSPMKC